MNAVKQVLHVGCGPSPAYCMGIDYVQLTPVPTPSAKASGENLR
jgi:hypothetical protein